MKDEKKDNGKFMVRKVRVAQALMLGVFTLGISMMAGDLSVAIKSPFTTLSITTTLFGLVGSVVCEIFARKAEKW